MGNEVNVTDGISEVIGNSEILRQNSRITLGVETDATLEKKKKDSKKLYFKHKG